MYPGTMTDPVYASSKWAINCFVQTVRRQVFKHGIRVGSISPGPVISALLADWPEEKLKAAKESGACSKPQFRYSRARAQAHRLWFALALHGEVPRAMDHHSSGCLPPEKFPTFAAG
jgi:NADP-dependent 3-hydroxy acid dehydrogenase YdfG